MDSVLVTGGAGFLGCTLTRKLLDAGYKVIVYDNFSFGSRKYILLKHPNLVVVEGDINNRQFLSETIGSHNPYTVVHLAALHFIPYCNQHPCETLRVNVEGTQALLEACRNSSVGMIAAASSAAVYPPKDSANLETDNTGSFDIYGASKVSMEQLMVLYHQETKKKCINLRFFNIYGPYETNPHLIPRIMEQYAKGLDVIELGNLTPKRDYIYTEDMADAIITICRSTSLFFETFNIGTGLEFSVTDVVDRLNHILNRNVRIVSVEKYQRKVEREHLLADISKIKRVTGWESRFSIEEGLSRTAEFYRLK